MMFNYANYLEKLPMVEEKDGYDGVQAWTTEYYRNLMEDLVVKLAVAEESIESSKQLDMHPIQHAITSSRIVLLKEILGKE